MIPKKYHYPAQNKEQARDNIRYAKQKVEESLHNNYVLRLHTVDFPIEARLTSDATLHLDNAEIARIQSEVIEKGWMEKLRISF